MKKYLILAGAVVLVVLAAVWIANVHSHISVSAGGQKACPTDAKICPDGSAVGRTGPNCTFAACPTITTPPPVNTTATTTLAIGDIGIVNHTSIRVVSLAQDTRCPLDVQCVQAGTVSVLTSINSSPENLILTLGQPQVVGQVSITLASVTPAKHSKQPIALSEYRFVFTVVPSFVTITSANGNATVHLIQNTNFKVALGDGLNWGQVTFSPANSVAIVSGPNPGDQSQGIYRAAQIGTTTLSATGGPVCSASEVCPQFVRLFTTTLVITQ